MFWFMIGATRTSDAEPFLEAAYVSCWINFPIRDGAEILARHYIEKLGWVPGTIEEARWVEEIDYAGRTELRFFKEAVQDGASFNFHTFPPGESA
jgi:hypothetical protein